jgi:hypothetical protein
MFSPSLKRQEFIGEWEPLKTLYGSLDVQSFEFEDGRRHIYAWREGEDITGREQSRDVNKIGYRVWPDGIQFLGMSVAYALRGAKMGQRLLEYFMGSVEQNEGQAVVGTGIIHKPLIALTLTRASFEPVTDEFQVEILPKSIYDHSDVPKVCLKSQQPIGSCLINSSHGQRFFELVDPDTALCYPINAPEMTVAINTRYTAPN